MMEISQGMGVSYNFVELFQSKRYEKYVLEIMNLSKSVFPGKYKKVTDVLA